MTLGTNYPTQGPLSTLASTLDTYSTDDFVALAFPGAVNVTRCTTELDATSNQTLANITGLLQAVVPGNYRFSCRIATSATGTGGGGVLFAFGLTTAVITSMDAVGLTFTTSAVAGSHTTTTATGTALLSSTTAAIYNSIDGTMVVGTGGTIRLQFAQSASSASTCAVLVGSSMEFTRLS